eukprot:g487.t1
MPMQPPTQKPAKRSKVEIIKERSDFLRHPLMTELVTENPYINEEAMQLMKFHGSYQQDHREKRAFGQGKFYQFMMRTKQPAGKVHWQLYVVMDDLSDIYGSGTLRLTTRQTFQLHGVLKEDLKTVFSTVVKNMGSTLGACGDLNRNVLAAADIFRNRPEYELCAKYANNIADLLAPQSGAYYDVWLDGEKFVSVYKEDPKVTEDREFNRFGTNFETSPEPIYGTQFLPRKFKIAVTVPGDNSVDLLTNDIGVVVMCNEQGELEGFNLLVGGGMGRTHRNDATFPRLADPLGFVAKDDIYHAIKAIVATQRDYGRRDDRKFSRMKYLVDEWGIDRFRLIVEQYFGKKFDNFRPLPEWKYEDYLGWGNQGDGKLYHGIFVQNGRLRGAQKIAIRTIIEKYKLESIITPNQNLVLTNIDPSWRSDIDKELKNGTFRPIEDVDMIDRQSMACPALPLCGLAIGEAERALPDVNNRIKALMKKLEVDIPVVIRMTGCPNGCSRPYMAELGFVGDGPNSYQVWLGGDSHQTRLAQVYKERMKISELESCLEPLLFYYKNSSESGEGFGDFCAKTGIKNLQDYASGYIPTSKYGALPTVKVEEDVHNKLEELAKLQGKTLSHLTNELLLKHISK